MGGGAFYQFMDGGALWLYLTGLPVSGWWHLAFGRVARQARELERPLMVRVGCRGSEVPATIILRLCRVKVLNNRPASFGPGLG